MNEGDPIRVLHIFNRMDRGGAETWIVNVMRHIDRERFKFDFLVESDQPGAYDDEIRAMGGELHHAGSPKRFYHFARAFRNIVRNDAPYDVVHSHVHHASGLMLALAAWQGIPVRIAHSHTDIRKLQQDASAPRRLYYRTTELLIKRLATAGLAVSRNAAASLFGPDRGRAPNWSVLHCGIDLKPFGKPVDREAVRARLGLPADAFVVGHVGRFMPVKNHTFLIDVFAQVHEALPKARLLLVGDGPLRGEIERKVEKLGLTECVVFAGVQENVPEILCGAMDVFVFPSIYEGLGLAVVEAHAAGLPGIVSDAIADETLIDPEAIVPLPIDAGIDAWRNGILERIQAADRSRLSRAANMISRTSFDIEVGTRLLTRVYLSEAIRAVCWSLGRWDPHTRA